MLLIEYIMNCILLLKKIQLSYPNCWKVGNVLHLMMISLGFIHETQRNDRENYVKIALQNAKISKFNKIVLLKNIFNKSLLDKP